MKKEKTKQQQPSPLSGEEMTKLLNGVVRAHMDLVKWLYDNHLPTLRAYEKTKGKYQIHFIGDKNGNKK